MDDLSTNEDTTTIIDYNLQLVFDESSMIKV